MNTAKTITNLKPLATGVGKDTNITKLVKSPYNNQPHTIQHHLL